MEPRLDCALSEVPGIGQGWDCGALRVVFSRCHPISPQTLNTQHSIQVTSSVYQMEKADFDEKNNFPLKITVSSFFSLALSFLFQLTLSFNIFPTKEHPTLHHKI